jgi:predicted DNA-binding protein YlxM (UPF0122 family)
MNNVVKRQVKYLKEINKLMERGYSLNRSCEKAGVCKQTYYNIANKYGKNLEDLDRKLNKSKRRSHRSHDRSSEYSTVEKSSETTENSSGKASGEKSLYSDDIQLLKTDGTPLADKSILPLKSDNQKLLLNSKLKPPLRKKPINQYTTGELDKEINDYYNKVVKKSH